MAAEHAQRRLLSKSGYAIWQVPFSMGKTKYVRLVEQWH